MFAALAAAHLPLFGLALWLTARWQDLLPMTLYAVVSALWFSWALALLYRARPSWLWWVGAGLLVGVQALLSAYLAFDLGVVVYDASHPLGFLLGPPLFVAAASAVFNLFALIAMIGIGVRRARVNRSTPKA